MKKNNRVYIVIEKTMTDSVNRVSVVTDVNSPVLYATVFSAVSNHSNHYRDLAIQECVSFAQKHAYEVCNIV